MAVRKISLHFDVISPYSWIGFELLHRHNRLWNDSSIKVINKPTFLGGIMHGSGNKPPGLVADKMSYMMHDLNRINQFTKSKHIQYIEGTYMYNISPNSSHCRSVHHSVQEGVD